ncbi:MAG: histidine phosphotransferase [Paracoccaceae bacterium]|nr:histidine phosphotransferase [Paracoccaceae bacterium]
MPEKQDISALLGSRICHDLISPLGAISNGIELLTMSGASVGPEIALISESVANANARVRFFRVAFGAASAEQRIGKPEILSILADVLRGGRLAVDWQVAGDPSRREVKLAFLRIQCLETAMAYGGTITVGRQEDTWLMTANAARLKIDPALWEVLSNPAAEVEVTAAQVHFLLAPKELRQLGRHLTVNIRETDIALSW